MMTMSENGLDLIKEFEGLRLKAYKDAVGVLTIGYGHTGKDVHIGMEISESEAIELLRQDVRTAERAINKQVQVALTQGQFDALVSFVYNLGSGNLHKSTLLRKLNAGYYGEAAAQFNRWTKAGGHELAGLVRRRQRETELFLS